eukprot:TRINITY_DN656_c0_g1_i1.p1 TRINITY_DN656_c0_g1~~TRINITY_DN656_c0_g1_i1.p1  ORF type:complete len:174 (-),score=32.64 TRINITY_DN656_c0_g1_i1:303-824(-)
MVGTGSVCTNEPHCLCGGFALSADGGGTVTGADLCISCGHERRLHRRAAGYDNNDDFLYVDLYYPGYYYIPPSGPDYVVADHQNPPPQDAFPPHAADGGGQHDVVQMAGDHGAHPNGPVFDDALANGQAAEPHYIQPMEVDHHAAAPDGLTAADFDIRSMDHHHDCCCCMCCE